jgi:hypothetical protein
LEIEMRTAILAAVLATGLMPAMANAQERAGDAALGALSGAVFLGPVGALAGAVVGYTAGPDISRSWGLRGSAPRRAKTARRTGDGGPSRQVATAGRSAPAGTQARLAPQKPGTPAPGASTTPVQGFD